MPPAMPRLPVSIPLTLPGLSPSLLRSARYRGEGTDLSKVPAFQRHGSDSGSPEVQIARLSARVQQLTEHLAVRRGREVSVCLGLQRQHVNVLACNLALHCAGSRSKQRRGGASCSGTASPAWRLLPSRMHAVPVAHGFAAGASLTCS